MSGYLQIVSTEDVSLESALVDCLVKGTGEGGRERERERERK